jgi:four helix bundle protein
MKNNEDFTFRKLKVYQLSKELVIMVYSYLKYFPKEEQYALCDQIRRAVVSVPSNIAEGMSRISKKERLHFLEISYGSLMETLCQIEISTELKFISYDDLQNVETKTAEISRMLSGLHSAIKEQVEREKR